MKKGLKRFFMACMAIFIMIPCLFTFTGCGFFGNDSVAEELAKELGYKSVEEMVEGLKGKDGKDGVDGAPGAPGKDAETLDSYDLYETAVENGEFTGTYMEFLSNFIDGEIKTQQDTSTVVNKIYLSVVEVYPYRTLNQSTGNAGSGVIVSLDDNGNAYVITNYHVAELSGSLTGCAPYYYLYLYQDDSAIQATFVGASATYDIAVLKVTNSTVLKESNAVAAEFDLEDIALGTDVISIGNTDGEGLAVSKGVVSVDSEPVTMDIGGERSIRTIRHDAFISHGNSGGGLFNMEGKLVGITNGGYEQFIVWNYALPATNVYKVYQNILANCNGTTSVQANVMKLGITTQAIEVFTDKNETTGEIKQVEVLQILEITTGSAVNVNDVLRAGDILKTIKIGNNEAIKITRNFHPKELMLDVRTGDTIVITATRLGETVTATFTADASYFATID